MTGHCSMCKLTKPRSEFHKNQSTCKPCHVLRQRQYRRTIRGFLDQKYTAMSKRVRGKDSRCAHIMNGMDIISRSSFIEWAYEQPTLKRLFRQYKQSNWDFKICPTVDRIDPTRGYTFDNMRFITQSENAKHRWDNGTIQSMVDGYKNSFAYCRSRKV